MPDLDLLVEVLELLLDDRLPLERRLAREILPAGPERLAGLVSSLTTLCSSWFVCSCNRFFAVTTSATPRLTFCSISSCFSYE